MPKPIIEVKNLSKVYKISHVRKPYHTLREDLIEAAKAPIRFLRGHRVDKEKFWALKNVSFDVKQGEVLGIIGRNGAGKSTLLKILSRITNPTGGSAILRGRVASLLEVGTGFHPELTGRENIYLNGALLGMSQQEISRKFDEIVSFSEIEKFLDTPVKFYSSGMYVRLAFAIAAHLEPEILIVDEVLSVGDAAFQRKSLGKMSAVAGGGRTVLFVSHNMGAIRQLCNRGLFLENGKATYFDDINDAITKYQIKNSPISGKGVAVSLSKQGISFDNFRLNGTDCSKEPSIFSGDPILFTCDYRSKLSSRKLQVGVGIKNKTTGNLTVFTHSGLENVKHKTGKEETVSVNLAVPKLAPGLYSFEFHVWLDDELVLTEYEICDFNIVSVPSFASKQTIEKFPSSVLTDSVWSFKKK